MDKLLSLQALQSRRGSVGCEHRDALERKLERDTMLSAVLVGAVCGFLVGLGMGNAMMALYELSRGWL